MSQPDVQRAAIVGVAYMGEPDDPDALVEAVEVTYGMGGSLPPEALIDGALSVVAPRYYVLEESRRQANWGATGLSVQDVVVLYSINTLSELTTAAIIAGLMKLSKVFHGRQIADAPNVAPLPQYDPHRRSAAELIASDARSGTA